jgi:DNA polymerase-4
MQALARGIDADPVMPHRDGKSIGHETTFDRDTDDGESIVATIRRFLGDLAHDLRSDGLAAEAFTVKLKDARFRITTRQRRFPDALNYDADMWRHIQPAVRGLLAPGVRYRLAGLSLSGLVPEVGSLFDARRPQALAAMDQLIDRFGTRVVRLGGIPEKED